MANDTDFSNLPETLTVSAKRYASLYLISLQAESLLDVMDSAGVEVPDLIRELWIDPIREGIAGVRTLGVD